MAQGTTITRRGGTGPAVRDTTTLHGRVLSVAQRTPQAPAVSGAAGETTYAALAGQVRAVAAGLTVAGIGAGDAVAVVGTACPEQIPAMLGVLAAGATYVPVAAGLSAEAAVAAMHRGAVRMALICGDLPPTWLPALTVREALRVGAGEPDFAPSADAGRTAALLATPTAAAQAFAHVALLEAIGTPPARGGRALVPTLDSVDSVREVFGTLLAGDAVVLADRDPAGVPADRPARFLPPIRTARVR